VPETVVIDNLRAAVKKPDWYRLKDRTTPKDVIDTEPNV
jgi:hypothetical protein